MANAKAITKFRNGRDIALFSWRQITSSASTRAHQPRSSVIETSKVQLVFKQIGTNPFDRIGHCSQLRKLIRDCCSIRTPLGMPVEPEV